MSPTTFLSSALTICLSSEILSPRLTTIQVFKQDMGQIAVKMMIEELTTGLEIKTKTQVSTKFIPGTASKTFLKNHKYRFGTEDF